MTTETMNHLLRNAATGNRHWFTDEALERAVSSAAGPEGHTCIAVMPADWPDDAGDFSDESNVWLLYDADETF